jgi:hypothetical protein
VEGEASGEDRRVEGEASGEDWNVEEEAEMGHTLEVDRKVEGRASVDDWKVGGVKLSKLTNKRKGYLP